MKENKPLLQSSDAHKLDNIGNKFTWIKADTTFEGLKQIIYEPKERVRIQKNKPEEKSSYQVIKAIIIKGEEINQKVTLNSNLNTIIGGRSTGKSTLLKIIANKINSQKVEEEFIKELIEKSNINIKWQDGEINKDRDIEYFHQNYMYDIANSNKKKNNLIERVVKEKDTKNKLGEYNNFKQENGNVIQSNLDDLFKIQNQIDQNLGTLKTKGDEQGIKTEISILEKKVKSLTGDENFSEEDLRSFEEIQRNIRENDNQIETLKKDQNKLEGLKEKSLFRESITYEFNNLSDKTRNEIQDIFDNIKQDAEDKWGKSLVEKIDKKREKINEIDKNTQIEKEKDFYKKVKYFLNQNKQHKELTEKLNIENKKLKEIQDIQKNIKNLKSNKEFLFDKIVDRHIKYETNLKNLINEFSLSYDGIEIRIEKILEEHSLENLLKDFINQQAHGRQKYVKEFIKSYKKNIKIKIKCFLKKALDNDDILKIKEYKDIKDLVKSVLTKSWFSISYQLNYQNDVFSQMSDGKKAFVILKILLDFSDKKCPILINQPEDSLDNRAIYSELVSYIKKKKKDRQIILVTHNANIVVSADAEEVIVANQNGNNSKNQNDIKFQYISGSLENTKSKDEKEKVVLHAQGIKEHVCEILEGGKDAFKKRKSKYGI